MRVKGAWRAMNAPGVLVSLALLGAVVGAALCAPWLTPYAAEGAGLPNMAHKLLAPSLAHPFGTDEMGRDLLARVMFGARTSLLLAALVVGSSVVAGVLVGLAAGASGRLAGRNGHARHRHLSRLPAAAAGDPAGGRAGRRLHERGAGIGAGVVALLCRAGARAGRERARAALHRGGAGDGRPAAAHRAGVTCCPTRWARCSCRPPSTSAP